MRVGITRIDPLLPLPQYASEGAAAFDFYCRSDVTIEPNSLAFLPTNVIIQVPHGYVLVLALRSGTPRRYSLLSPHGVGIIDPDFCGPEDEIQIQVFNFSRGPVTVHRGERIAQGLFIQTPPTIWEEREPSAGSSRGGFGSTG